MPHSQVHQFICHCQTRRPLQPNSAWRRGVGWLQSCSTHRQEVRWKNARWPRYCEAWFLEHLQYSDAMLKAIADRVPSIYKSCHLSYSQPSVLKFNNHRFMSEEGPQQGDPLGGLLFCNTIHPLLSQMKADLFEDYMDDITLSGTRNDVASDVTKIRSKDGVLSLQINVKKCELIQRSSTSAEPAFQDFIILTPDNVKTTRWADPHSMAMRKGHHMGYNSI